MAPDAALRPYYGALDEAWGLPQITEIGGRRGNGRVPMLEAIDQK